MADALLQFVIISFNTRNYTLFLKLIKTPILYKEDRTQIQKILLTYVARSFSISYHCEEERSSHSAFPPPNHTPNKTSKRFLSSYKKKKNSIKFLNRYTPPQRNRAVDKTTEYIERSGYRGGIKRPRTRSSLFPAGLSEISNPIPLSYLSFSLISGH